MLFGLAVDSVNAMMARLPRSRRLGVLSTDHPDVSCCELR